MRRISLVVLFALRLTDAATVSPEERSVQEIAPNAIDTGAAEVQRQLRLLQQNPEDAQANVEYGRLLNRPGTLDLARRYFLKALALRPDDPEARHQLGLNFALRKAWPEALTELKNAVWRDARNPVFGFDLAAAYYNSGSFADAEHEFRKAVALDKARYEFQFGLAAALEAQKKLPESESEYLMLVKQHPDRAAGQYGYASVLLQLDKREEAKRRVQLALSLDPALADAHYLLGKILEKESKMEPAAVAYRRAVELQPGHQNAHYRLAAVYQRLGETAKAHDEADIFRHLQAVWQARSSLEFGIASLQAGRLEIARTQLQTALDNDPQDPRILYFNGLVCQKEGRTEKALEFYAKALALRPGLDLVQAQMGELLAQLGRKGEARDALGRATGNSSNEFEALETTGRGWLQLGQYAESESAFGKALDLWPEHPRTLLEMFQLYVLWGKEPEAQSFAERAARANPRNPRVLERIGLFWAAEGDLPKAREILRAVQALEPDYHPADPKIAALLQQ